MSESWYVNENIQSFSSSHPYAEGWKVYELPSGLARKRFLHYLLDFLRDQHPGAVERRTTVKEILDEELVGTPSFVHPADPGTEWDLSHELDSDGWSGRVDITWEGHPIQVVSFLLKYDSGYINAYHIATRSNVALRRLLQEVERYGQ